MSPNATNPVDLPDNSAKVSFSNDIEHAAPVDSYSRKTSTELRAAKDRQSLSASAKAWDIDGDGELDEAELALRALDKSHKGTLSKEQMYQLMNQSLTVERELGKVKKVVIGLVVFTCVLALANVGTSFAAAYLAKDTTTQEGKLVDSKTGDILAVNSAATNFEVDNELSRRHRALCEITTGNGNKIASAACSTSSAILTPETGRDLAKACKDGGSATLSFTYTSGTVVHPVCPPPGTASYSGNGNSNFRGITTSAFSIEPDSHDSATQYTATGFASTQDQACDFSSDCADNFTCQFNQIGEGSCACANNDACSGDEICEADCQVADGPLPRCRTQANLDSTCLNDGETCTLGGPYSVCEVTTHVILPVEGDDVRN